MFKQDTALIVENNTDIRNYITSILKQQLNYQLVLAVPDTKSAYSIINSGTQSIDWIFFEWDINSQEANDFLKKIRESSIYADIPFIFMTHKNNNTFLKNVIQLGATDYLIKPFTLSISHIPQVKKSL